MTTENNCLCEWPGCNRPAHCRSGNVNGALVCATHFKITNGIPNPHERAIMNQISATHILRARRLRLPTALGVLDDVLEHLESLGKGDHDLAWSIRYIKCKPDSILVDDLLKLVDKRLNPERPTDPVSTVDKQIQTKLFDLGKLTRIRNV